MRADPLNLTGIVLPGPRIPAIGSKTVTYVNGAVAEPPAIAGTPGKVAAALVGVRSYPTS